MSSAEKCPFFEIKLGEHAATDRSYPLRRRHGGFTDQLGYLVYSKSRLGNFVPAFLIENSTANLCGLNERKYDRRPCEFWFREEVNGETREQKERAWVYLRQ